MRWVVAGAVAVAAGATALTACGGNGDATTAGEKAASDRRPPLVCASGRAVRQADASDDVAVRTATGPHVQSPSGDLVEVTLRRGEDGVLCLAFRTAAAVRPGSTFSLEARQADAAGHFDEQRYEVQLGAEGEVNVSRPHGEPRYPVRATVARRGARLQFAMQTLLGGEESFGWRVDLQYLPRFPLGDVYADTIPDGAGWLQFTGTG